MTVVETALGKDNHSPTNSVGNVPKVDKNKLF